MRDLLIKFPLVEFLSIVVALGLPYFYLFNRKKAWLQDFRKLGLAAAMLLTGLIGCVLFEPYTLRLFSFSLMVPPFIFLMERIFKQWSILLHERDFYLWLEGSTELDDIEYGKNTRNHLKASDRICLMVLLFSIFGLLFVGGLLFGVDGILV